MFNNLEKYSKKKKKYCIHIYNYKNNIELEENKDVTIGAFLHFYDKT